MLGTKRPASTLDHAPPSPPTAAKRLKPNRPPTSTPSTADRGFFSSLSDVAKNLFALVTPSPIQTTRPTTAAAPSSTTTLTSGATRSRQRPLEQRSIPRPYTNSVPAFKDDQDTAIWHMITARQRGQPPVAPQSNVLLQLGMNKPRRATNSSRDATSATPTTVNAASTSASAAGGYQRKKPMGSKEKPSSHPATTADPSRRRRQSRLPTPDFLANASSTFDPPPDASTPAHCVDSKRAQRDLYDFVTRTLPRLTTAAPDSPEPNLSPRSSRSSASSSPDRPQYPLPQSPIVIDSSPPRAAKSVDFFASPWLPASFAAIRRKQHRLALRNRDHSTLESLRSLPSTPANEQEEQLRVYREGVGYLVRQEDDQAQQEHRPKPPHRSTSSLLGPPSSTYASVVSRKRPDPSATPVRPLSKTERTIEMFRKTQSESPAKREAELIAKVDRLRLEQELRAEKDLADETSKTARPKSVEQKKRKWPKQVPREVRDRVSTILTDVKAGRQYDKTIPGASVDAKAISRLRPGVWLDDSIIAFYGVLINNRFLAAEKRGDLGDGETRLRKVWCFNSFFWNMYEENGYKRVKKWTKKFDVFEKDIIIFPINIHNTHWTCAAVNVKQKRFEYYDSLGSRMQKAHSLLRKWLQEEHECKKGGPIDLSDWEDYWNPNVPQQDNSVDCGVFTCAFMELLSREYEGFDFDHRQMPYLRQKIAYEIDQAELVPEEFE